MSCNDDIVIYLIGNKKDLEKERCITALRGNNKSNSKFKYRPKRLVKLYGGEIPLKMVGKATLDCTKIFYKDEGEMSNIGKKNKIFFSPRK